MPPGHGFAAYKTLQIEPMNAEEFKMLRGSLFIPVIVFFHDQQ